MYNGDDNNVHMYNIVSKTENEIRLQHADTTALPNPSYLGALASLDGTEVYWINNSAPLP